MKDGEEKGEGSSSADLACVSCRSRKLKCDRTKPVCTRCARVQAECVYPESRRKPSFKRRNVKELEARLAQVEDLLKGATSRAPLDPPDEDDDGFGVAEFSAADIDWQGVVDMDLNEDGGMDLGPDENMGFTVPEDMPTNAGQAPSGGDLIDLGLFETLPPYEVMEDLHKIYFSVHHVFIPIIHPGRYLHAFYSAPHMRPPMCLQYAIWAMASNGHEKYGTYHDVFYQRSRQYAAADEMKGSGEHFLTIAHAQAWALIATNEARQMYFTRAAMSSARCVRLVHMMGLHRLDASEMEEVPPVILPPQNWTELEERRRVFWGAFAIDSHASISTGWPSLIDLNDVTTRLPCTEASFQSETEEKTVTLQEAVTSSTYSSFSGALIICHIFNMILKHVHRPRPNDRPEDVEYGEFWKRHRDIDNTLTGAFMFMPENFRLPRNLRDPVAVHTNLNLHASVICLHNAAVDRADMHNLPEHVKKASMDRISTAAQEIVNIMKLTSHVNAGYKSPMIALSLYCAASVYIYQAKECVATENFPASSADNLEFILRAMEAIGRDHMITRSFLQQVVLDVEANGVLGQMRLPRIDKVVAAAKTLAPCFHMIPLLARSNTSRHTGLQPPLPGRLPLGRPRGGGSINSRVYAACGPMDDWPKVQAALRNAQNPHQQHAEAGADDGEDGQQHDTAAAAGPSNANSNKRKRSSPPHGSTGSTPNTTATMTPVSAASSGESTANLPPAAAAPSAGGSTSKAAGKRPQQQQQQQMSGWSQCILPDRTSASPGPAPPPPLPSKHPKLAGLAGLVPPPGMMAGPHHVLPIPISSGGSTARSPQGPSPPTSSSAAAAPVPLASSTSFPPGAGSSSSSATVLPHGRRNAAKFANQAMGFGGHSPSASVPSPPPTSSAAAPVPQSSSVSSSSTVLPHGRRSAAEFASQAMGFGGHPPSASSAPPPSPPPSMAAIISSVAGPPPDGAGDPGPRTDVLPADDLLPGNALFATLMMATGTARAAALRGGGGRDGANGENDTPTRGAGVGGLGGRGRGAAAAAAMASSSSLSATRRATTTTAPPAPPPLELTWTATDLELELDLDLDLDSAMFANAHNPDLHQQLLLHGGMLDLGGGGNGGGGGGALGLDADHTPETDPWSLLTEGAGAGGDGGGPAGGSGGAPGGASGWEGG